ncbi:MAG: hypothetical protein QOI35_2844 [Cryptosporangiaceae bacterium]|jgi:hypothetical protein|nr:hypothetical protein [Cryptosporangiaceae bacterium]
MTILESIGGVLAAGILFLMALFARRLLIARGGGTIEVSVRLYRRQHGRGWALGLARFSGDKLLWYRMFSLAVRPRVVISRKDLHVLDRREPSGSERVALLAGSVILECQTASGPIEVAMDSAALTGFLSWLESAAPGSSPYAAR